MMKTPQKPVATQHWDFIHKVVIDSRMEKKLSVNSLKDVPETMLLTLYDRACEAKRLDKVLYDPESIRIYDAIEYDFTGKFGKPRGGMAARAASLDKIIKDWLRTHPNGLIVSLGEGLETQRYRVDNGKVHWLSIDLPEAIAIREKFIKPSERFKHLAHDAFDFSWMNQIDPSHGLLIIAQGLFMYFDENRIKSLIIEIFRRFPQAQLLFDFVSQTFVSKAQKGYALTPHYKLPLLHWGIGYDEIENTLRTWVPSIKTIRIEHYDIFTHGFMHIILDRILRSIPFIGNLLPGIAYLNNGVNQT